MCHVDKLKSDHAVVGKDHVMLSALCVAPAGGQVADCHQQAQG